MGSQTSPLIDLNKIKAELNGLANPAVDEEGHPISKQGRTKVVVEVRSDARMHSACRVDEWEKGGRIGFTFSFNPRRIRTAAELERHLQYCRESITD